MVHEHSGANNPPQDPSQTAELASPIWPTEADWPSETGDLGSVAPQPEVAGFSDEGHRGTLGDQTAQAAVPHAEEAHQKEVDTAAAQADVRAAFEQTSTEPAASAPNPAQPSSAILHPFPAPKPEPAANPENLSAEQKTIKNEIIKIAQMTPAELVAVDPSTLHPSVAQSKEFKDQRFRAAASVSSDMARQLRGEPSVHTYTKQEVIDFAQKVYNDDIAFRYDDDPLTVKQYGPHVQAPESEILEKRISRLYEDAVGSPEHPEDFLLSPAVVPRSAPEKAALTPEEIDRKKMRDDANLISGMTDAELARYDTSSLHPSVRDSEGLRNRRFRGAGAILEDMNDRVAGLGKPVTKREILDFINQINNEGTSLQKDNDGNLTPESSELLAKLNDLRLLTYYAPGGPDDIVDVSTSTPPHAPTPPPAPTPAPTPTTPPVRRPIRTVPAPTSGTSGEKLSTSPYYATMHEGGVFVGDKILADKLLDQGGTADVVLKDMLDRIGGDHINTNGFPTAGEYVWDTLNGLTFDGMNLAQATEARQTLATIQEMVKKNRFSKQFTSQELQAIGIGMIRAQDAINSAKSEAVSMPVEIPTDEYTQAYQYFVGPLTGAEVPKGRARATGHNTPWTALASRVNKIEYNGEMMTEYDVRVKQDMEQVGAAAKDPRTIAWIANLPKKYITPPARERAFLILARHSAKEAAEKAADAEDERVNRLKTPLDWGKPHPGQKISDIPEPGRSYFVASALIDRKKQHEASGTVDSRSSTELEAKTVDGLITMMVEGMTGGDRRMTSDALFALRELTKNIPTTDKPILDKAVRSKKYDGTPLEKLFRENDIATPTGQRKIINALQNPSSPSVVSRMFGRKKP